MKIKKLNRIAMGAAIGLLITACTASRTQMLTAPLPSHKVISVTGYGTAEKNDRFSRQQIKLLAMRAAKMDAYRGLAEQIYGIQLDGKTTVENMIITHDSYRAFIHTYLRGARVVRTSAIGSDIYAGNDTYEAVMEIDLTPRFYECVNGSRSVINQCLQQTSANPASGLDYASIPVHPSAHSSCNSIDCYGYPDTRGFNRR